MSESEQSGAGRREVAYRIFAAEFDDADFSFSESDEELTAEVYGGDLEAAMDHARDAMDREVVAEEIASKVVGHEYVVRGSLTIDDYGANLEASTFDEHDEDPATRAKQFLSEVEQ